MKISRYLACFGLMAAIAGPANAQFRKPEDAIRYRQSVMYTMGNHFYARLGSMANGRTPFDARAAAENAEIAVVLSKLAWGAFPPGSETGTTSAKAAIWTDPEKFKDLGEKMQSEMGKLLAASKTGSLDNLKTAYRATSNACKACHDVFVSE